MRSSQSQPPTANQITLTTPLKFDHKGARSGDDKLEFLPHIGNLTRNVVVRSENPNGTRGHMIFMARADIDLRYVEVRDMGRTKLGILDNTEFDNDGKLTKLGTNQNWPLRHPFPSTTSGPSKPPPTRIPVHAGRQRRRQRSQVGRPQFTTATTD